MQRAGWFADQFLVASADAWLAAGEPQQAIAALTPSQLSQPAEAPLPLGEGIA